MAELNKDYPTINWTPVFGGKDVNKINRTCSSCKHEITDWYRIQNIKQQIRDRVPVEKQTDHYCKLQEKGKKCKWQKKRDK